MTGTGYTTQPITGANPSRLAGKYPSMTGLTLVEVLVAMALIAVALVPALQALQSGIQGSGIHREQTANHYHLTMGFENVLAQPYVDLLAAALVTADPKIPTSYSDLAGDPRRRLVFLSPYDLENLDGDGDLFTAINNDLLWVRIEIENTALAMESITSVYE